ncbi:hypothetical protein BS47DRAFT_1402992 [Hydnum rufescens UP504]|uniref:Uncharacterized protein n=1 Tax=Hydnum rufescens UP504 TaxID=1448309 RepID=A0A9P6ADE2_9AGAM|nr:hypothetical protein BS47DRAFT_1402992 [Hydnum rufescens UP504]
MKALITKKVLKTLNDGRLVQANGLSLPCGDLDDGSIAQVLRNQMSHALNIETEYLHSFDLFNQEESKGHSMECPNHAYVELPQQAPASQPTTILKCETSISESVLMLPDKIVKIHSGNLDHPQVHRPTAKTEDLSMSEFPSETQETNLCALTMTKKITVDPVDVFGSLLGSGKRLWTALKTQPVPAVPEATHTESDDVLINSAEYRTNPLHMKKQSLRRRLINRPPKTIMHNVVDSDDESSDEDILAYSSSSALNIDDQADEVNSQHLEVEHKCEFNAQELDYTVRPSVLMMVIARTQSTISYYPYTMVIANGNCCL